MVMYQGEVKPVTVPVMVKDKWYEKLAELQMLIYNRITTKIPDEQSYINKLATPSAEGWYNFVSPYWLDADLITLKQRVKVSMAGPKYLNNITRAFVTGTRFIDGIFGARYVLDSLDMFRYTLGGVGIRYETGWGAIYKAVGVLTGDHRVAYYMTAEDKFQGPVVNAFPTDIVKYVRPLLIAMLTQGSVLAYYTIERNLPSLMNQVIAAVNSKIASAVSGLKSPEFTTVTLELRYEDFDKDGTEELTVYAFAE